MQLKCKLKIRLSSGKSRDYFMAKMKSLGADFVDVSSDWFVDLDGNIKRFQNAIVIVDYDRVWEMVDEVATNMSQALLMELTTMGVDKIGVVANDDEEEEVIEEVKVESVEKMVEPKPVKTEVEEVVVQKGKNHGAVVPTWSEKDVATLMLLHDEGLSNAEIGERMGRSTNAIYKKLRRLDKTQGAGKKKLNEDVAENTNESEVTDSHAWTEDELDLLSNNLDKDIDELSKMFERPVRQIERKIDRLLDGKER